jgi:hypothetical protein
MNLVDREDLNPIEINTIGKKRIDAECPREDTSEPWRVEIEISGDSAVVVPSGGFARLVM